MIGRSHLAIDRERPLRHALEIRHESFLDERFVAMLRAHDVALVIAETARTWPMARDVTADFVYLRLHGDRELYRSGYGPRAISRWADRIAAWHRGSDPVEMPRGAVRITSSAPRAARGRDVYCYFDNTDVKLRAPADARALMRKLGLPVGTRVWTNGRKPGTRAARTSGIGSESRLADVLAVAARYRISSSLHSGQSRMPRAALSPALAP